MTYDRATFLDAFKLTPETREVAWGMLAEVVRAASRFEDDPPAIPFRRGETKLRDLLAHFASDLDAVEDADDADSSTLAPRVFAALEASLAGKRAKFPFGELTLDDEARVRELRPSTGENTAEAF